MDAAETSGGSDAPSLGRYEIMEEVRSMQDILERDPARLHFPRVWAARHDESVHVFASGDVYDNAQRRRCIRQNITAQREYRAYWRTRL